MLHSVNNTRFVTTHPGEILRFEFLAALGISAKALAIEMGVPAKWLQELMAGRRSVTVRIALKLAQRFDTSPEFWTNLQFMHDLSKKIVRGRS